MTDVRMPDGTVVRFPDDMPKEQVRALIAERFAPAQSAAPAQAPATPASPGVPPQQPGQLGLNDLILGRKRQPTGVEDVAKAIGSGLVTGTEALVGLPGDVQSGMQWVGDRVGDFLYGPEKRQAADASMAQIAASDPTTAVLPQRHATTQDVASFQRGITGFQPYQPQTTAGQFANTAAEFVPSALAMGPARQGVQGALSNAIKFGIVPGVASEGAGQLAQQAFPAAEPFARFAGAMAGPLMASGMRKAITPTRSDPYAQAAANALEREGVQTTAGQRTGSHALRYAEDEIGGPRAAQFYETQGEQFTRAVLRRAGINADRATPQVMDDAFNRLGAEFDRLAANTTARVDQQTIADLNRAYRDYVRMTPPNSRIPAVRDFRAAIMTAPNNQLTGQQYQYVRSELGRLARQMATTGGSQGYQGASALRSFQEALDDAVGRSITNPDALTQWRQVRQQYRNILPIEEAMARAGEGTAKGLVPPAGLRGAISRRRDRRGYVRGRGDYSNLARAAEAVMKPMPQSGTAPRLAARGLIDQTPTAIGGALGYAGSGGDWMGTLAGLAAGRASQGLVNAGAREAMFSPAGRAYFANQLLPPPNYSPLAGFPAMLATARLPLRGER